MRRKCTDDLTRWKKNPNRRPLVLKGIRQTGKTWILRDFGIHQYENMIYINLEANRPVTDYLSVPREAEEALLFLETYANKPLHKESTLLILDGIQCIPQIAKLLAAIAVEYPGYHISAIERGISGTYDSGDAEILQLTPLDFEEFLWANKEYALAREIRDHFSEKKPMGKELHAKAMTQFRLYLAIGGLPSSILEYRKEKKLLMVPDIQQKLLALMLADIASGSPEGLSRHCRNCWLSIPSQLCKENGKFQYRQVVKGGTAKIYEEPLNWLIQSGLAYRSSKQEGSLDNMDASAFRLYFPDTGLSACQLGTPSYLLLSGEGSSTLKGIAETFLAQTFIQNSHQISYWNSGNQAEIPFILRKGGEILAVDFRITPHQKTRNLARLNEICEPNHMYLVSVEDFRQKELYDIIPFYAAFCI